ncbi:MAG: DUF5677 domain-containing protein [Candidatus Omnitrophica bacterium]|nr:DUF5677 domain-containing protein [Candidatus Omnitrophota bacterium]
MHQIYKNIKVVKMVKSLKDLLNLLKRKILFFTKNKNNNFQFTNKAIKMFDKFYKKIKNEQPTKERKVAKFLLLFIYANIKAFISLCNSKNQFNDASAILHLRPILEAFVNFNYIFNKNNSERNTLIELFANYETIKLYKLAQEYKLLSNQGWQSIKDQYEKLQSFYEDLDKSGSYKGIKEKVYEKGNKWINKNFKEILKGSSLATNEYELRGFISIYSITSGLIHGSASLASKFFTNLKVSLYDCYSYDLVLAYKLIQCLNLALNKNIFYVDEKFKKQIYEYKENLESMLENIINNKIH